MRCGSGQVAQSASGARIARLAVTALATASRFAFAASLNRDPASILDAWTKPLPTQMLHPVEHRPGPVIVLILDTTTGTGIGRALRQPRLASSSFEVG